MLSSEAHLLICTPNLQQKVCAVISRYCPGIGIGLLTFSASGFSRLIFLELALQWHPIIKFQAWQASPSIHLPQACVPPPLQLTLHQPGHTACTPLPVLPPTSLFQTHCGLREGENQPCGHLFHEVSTLPQKPPFSGPLSSQVSSGSQGSAKAPSLPSQMPSTSLPLSFSLRICLGNLRNVPKPKPPGAVKLPISTRRLESENGGFTPRPSESHAPLRVTPLRVLSKSAALSEPPRFCRQNEPHGARSPSLSQLPCVFGALSTPTCLVKGCPLSR